MSAKTKLQRRAFFRSLQVIPGYICRTCWSAVAWAPSSKEPKCRCKDPVVVPVDMVVCLPDLWWHR